MDDDGHLRNINTPCGQVGRYHHGHARRLEIRQHLAALALAELAMQRFGGYAALTQLIGHDLCGEFGGHEHQHPIPPVLRQQMPQQAGAQPGVHGDGAVADGRCRRRIQRERDAKGLAQQGIGQGLHRSGKRGREKQVLAARGQQCRNLRPLRSKAGVQHAVGLVEHQHFNGVDGKCIALQQIQQTPRRCHHQVCTATQSQHLRIHRHPAKHRAHPQVQSLPPGLRQAGHLHHQLAGGHQHQSPDGSFANRRCNTGCEPVQQGQ